MAAATETDPHIGAAMAEATGKDIPGTKLR